MNNNSGDNDSTDADYYVNNGVRKRNGLKIVVQSGTSQVCVPETSAGKRGVSKVVTYTFFGLCDIIEAEKTRNNVEKWSPGFAARLLPNNKYDFTAFRRIQEEFSGETKFY